jgi:hypothetical protein
MRLMHEIDYYRISHPVRIAQTKILDPFFFDCLSLDVFDCLSLDLEDAMSHLDLISSVVLSCGSVVCSHRRNLPRIGSRVRLAIDRKQMLAASSPCGTRRVSTRTCP